MSIGSDDPVFSITDLAGTTTNKGNGVEGDVGVGQVTAALHRELAAGRPFAVATIVGTEGSTYRHTGARLLVRDDGSWVGNISGGCLEGEVAEVGRRVMDAGEPETVTYDLTADEEAIWGWGLGCNGVIEVLVEPPGPAAVLLDLLERASTASASVVLATVVDGQASWRHALVDSDGDVVGDVPPEVVSAARQALEKRRTERRVLKSEQDELDVLLRVVRPPRRLLVCGAGHDAVPLVRQARRLGWQPVVVDDRSSFLTEERFPEAIEFVHAPPAEAADAAEIRERTAVVIMSHNFLRDVDYLKSFLGTDIDYLGTLGPSRRLQRLLTHLEKEDVRPSSRDRELIHGPAGLDIGAEGPEEIAWSITAEILAVERGRSGGSLSERSGSIHGDDRDCS